MLNYKIRCVLISSLENVEINSDDCCYEIPDGWEPFAAGHIGTYGEHFIWLRKREE